MNDKDILACVLAVQVGFVTRDTLLDACSELKESNEPAISSLLEEGVLSKADAVRVAQIMEAVLDKHESDAGAAVLALASISDICSEISRLLSDLGNADTVKFDGSSRADAPPLSRETSPFQMQANPEGELASTHEEHRFSIIRQHAQGGLGVVHLAEDLQLGRNVALKEIREDRADDEYYRVKFIHEAEVTGRLEHPGVVPIYSLGADRGGRPYYAMRFIHGESMANACVVFHLTQKGKHGSLDCPELRELLRRLIDVCNVIEYCHDQGVIHRDLKPSNIMVGKYGETLVVDWGLAKRLGDVDDSDTDLILNSGDLRGLSKFQTSQGQFLGTLAYAPPEQLEGDLRRLGIQSDIYSLGAILFELLTGKVPIPQVTSIQEATEALRSRESRGCLDFNSRVPPALAAICDKAMASSQADRYADAGELAAELERWLDDSPTQAYREPLRDKAFRWVRKHQTTTATVLVAVVATIALASGFMVIQSGAAQRETELQAENIRREAELQAENAEVQEVFSRISVAEARGDLNEFIRGIDELRLKDVTLTDRQKILEAKYYYSTQRPVSALELLNQLESSEFSPVDLAQHDMLRGDILFSSPDDVTGKRLLEKSLDSGVLGPADAAYVRGVLAPTPTECMDELTRCLALDPQNSMARIRLAMTQVLAGTPRRAIASAKIGKVLAPDDWRFDITMALAYATMANTAEMEVALNRIENTPDASPLVTLCRLINDMHLFVVAKFQSPQPQLQVSDLTRLIGWATQIVNDVIPAIRGKQLVNGIVIPNLAWVGTVNQAAGVPALEPGQLSVWIYQMFFRNRTGDVNRELAKYFPEHRLVQSLHMTSVLESGRLDEALAIMDRIRSTESPLDGLDLNLAVWLVIMLGNQEPAVGDGTRTRLQQVEDLRGFANSICAPIADRVFAAAEESYPGVAWGLLLKNGFVNEATDIAEKQLAKDTWTGDARVRWEGRLALSIEKHAEFNDVMQQFAVRTTDDPRFIVDSAPPARPSDLQPATGTPDTAQMAVDSPESEKITAGNKSDVEQAKQEE